MSPTQLVGEVPCPKGKASGTCSISQCLMLVSKEGRGEAGTERASASVHTAGANPEGCWAARSPSPVLCTGAEVVPSGLCWPEDPRSPAGLGCLGSARSTAAACGGLGAPPGVHNVLCLLLGVPEGGGDAQAGEAARQADNPEDNPPPGRLQGLPQPPEVQEAEGIHPLGCHALCPPKPRLGPLHVGSVLL